MNKNIFVLGIETSCDETSVAVVKNGRTVVSNVIYSQIPIHQKFGGVVPEIASRQHIVEILPVIDQALKQAEISLEDISAIGVTYGPGLVGALLVGVAAAKGLAFALDKPLIGVNHLEGHVFANFIEHKELQPPFISLVVSGGHTSLLKVVDYKHFELLGQTRDDAAGEAFDKVARVLGLAYPGGPEVEKLARQGNPHAINFPRASKMGEYEFSFSGLKSSVINYLHNLEQSGKVIDKADVAASFQSAVVDVLVDKSLLAIKNTGLKELVLAGGVSANNCLRESLTRAIALAGGRLYYPSLLLCTDNAAMIACRAYYLYIEGKYSGFDLNAKPSLKLGS